MTTIKTTLPYLPREAFRPFHNRKQRWAVIVAHRRAGKTVSLVNELIKGALTCEKENPRFAYIAPTYKQAKDIAWDYLKKYGLVIPGAVANESELRVDFPNGGRVRVYGAPDPDSLRGIYLDGVALDEYADLHPRLLQEVIRPALSDRKGWAAFSGTPKGHNDFYDLWQVAQSTDDYFALLLKASETGLVDADELRDAKRVMTPEQYDQEYECSFNAAILGAYYGREMQQVEDERRISEAVYEAGLPVTTAWDLGMSDHTVIWFVQQTGRDIRVIDYYAASGFGLDHYAQVLRDKGYNYSRHLWPHDGRNRDLTSGKSREQYMRELGFSVDILPKHTVDDGISEVRRMLPRCFFQAGKTEEGVKALSQYRRDYDEVRKVFYERPVHDWASHPADAFRYLAMGLREPTARNRTQYRRHNNV